MNKKNKVLFVAGKSGGHIIPCLTIATKKEYSNAVHILITCDGAFDKMIVDRHGFTGICYTMPLSKVKLTGIGKLWAAVLCSYSFFKSFMILMRYRPAKVISTGGIIGIPVGLAAWFLRIPVELYELNAIPGKASNVIARFAKTVYICFEKTRSYFPRSCQYISYPVRFTQEVSTHTIEKIYTQHGFDQSHTTILVLGGSQGSQFLNNLMITLIKEQPTLHTSIQIIHQAGNGQTAPLKAFYESHAIPAIVFDYTPDIDAFYTIADHAICRAGAGTLFELVHFKVPCIAIPLITQTTDHQKDNVLALAQEYPQLIQLVAESDAIRTLCASKIFS